MRLRVRGETMDIRPGAVHSSGELPVPSDVPGPARRTIEDQIHASIERETERRGTEATAAQEFGEQYRSELRGLLGPDGYAEYRGMVRDEKRRRGELLVPRGRVELSARQRQSLRAQQRKRFASFLKARGVGAKRVAAVEARVQRRLAKLLGPAPGRMPDRPVPQSKVPARILASVGDPIADPTPPYANLGFWSWWHFAGDDGDEFSVTGFDWGYDKATGRVGNTAQVAVQDASNSDTVVETRRTLFGFWTQLPPNTKSLNIWVNADITHGQFLQTLTTEFFGVSHGFFHHDNWLFSEVIGGSDTQSHQARSGHSWWQKGSQLWPVKLEGTWESGMVPGSGWWLLQHDSLPPLVPVGNGQGALIWVGTESTAKMWVDDEDGLGWASFVWRLNSIQFDPVT